MKNGFKKPYSLKNENTIKEYSKFQEEAEKQNKKVPPMREFLKVLFGRKS